jgi:hypothetical protein
MIIQTACIECGDKHAISCTTEQYKRYVYGDYVQDIFPELDAGTRELLISGICNDCWDNIFAFMQQE